MGQMKNPTTMMVTGLLVIGSNQHHVLANDQAARERRGRRGL